MHFCSKMPVSYLRKGTKTNVKDPMFLANQANMNFVKNRM